MVSFIFGLIVKWRKHQGATGLNFLSKLQDTARYAAFLATYSGAFVAVDEGIAALFGKRRCAEAMLAGQKAYIGVLIYPIHYTHVLPSFH